ncbi:MAG: homocysteine biosynthesis protein [Candidatus Freyarchaeum deiterrae]
MISITENNLKTYEEINEKIKKGDAVVVTAEEMVRIVEEQGEKKAANEIDVVTTGTFGAMCSSGAFLNFGHSDPPIKMEQLWLNDVEAYHGNAAVDCYIGATKMSASKPFIYGGGHVIEDLAGGKEITLRARAYGTDCYPRTSLETTFNIDDLNQAILCNPRNAYQGYNAATNGRNETIYTYMGKLLANYGNVTYSGSGCLSPLYNDPDYETIGIGTRIFLGGGVGYIIGEGTQHNPKNYRGTIMAKGDLKQMNSEYLKGASFTKYGTTLYVGLGIPIPILNEGLARKTAISDADISTEVIDYGVPRLNRPSLRKVTYQELKSERIQLNGKTVKVSSLSSLKTARKVAQALKKWIEEGRFFLSKPAETLPTTTGFKPMKITKEIQYVRSIMIPAITTTTETSIHDVAKLIVEKNVNHIVIVNNDNTLKGIVTSFDVTRAVANNKNKLEEIAVKRVYTAKPDDPVDAAVKELETHKISALPVIDEKKKVLGIITSEEISRLLA